MNVLTSIFTKASSEITYEDIEAFCDLRIAECETIDYKQDAGSFSKIIKTIAAMSNTDGGIIILGVPEEKDQGKEGVRSYPGKPVGFDRESTGIMQRVASACNALLQPVFCPEIIEIATPSQEKTIVLIRIDRDAVPSLPVFHRESGIQVRLGEENRPASPEKIKLLFEETSKDTLSMESPIYGQFPNTDGFCWCCVTVRVPMRRFTGSLVWNSERINMLKEAVEGHNVGGAYPWTQKYHMRFTDEEPYIITPETRELARPSVIYHRGARFVRFNPVPSRIDANPWFDISFYPSGYMMASVGLPVNDSTAIDVESIIAVYYAITDLFLQDQVKACYPDALWHAAGLAFSHRIERFPGTLRSEIIKGRQPIKFPAEGSSVGGTYYPQAADELDSERIVKELIWDLLAEIGYLNYEASLATLNIRDYFECL